MAQQDRDDSTNGSEEVDSEIPTMQKVAILFVALGQETAGEVMKFLSDYEIEEITHAVAALKGISEKPSLESLRRNKFQPARRASGRTCGSNSRIIRRL